MSSKFRKAERKHAKLRLAFCGPAGSGKTYSALLLAQGLSPNGKIAMVDTEFRSGDLYANLFDYDIAPLDPPFTPRKYINLISDAETDGYDVLILDSLSHAWTGRGGVLEMHDNATSASASGNSYMAWREVTPQHNALVDAILTSNLHIIATMRTKTAYEIVTNSKGKKTPVKIGLAPIQREGMDYEFTVVLDLSVSGHMATATKDRTSLLDGRHFVPDVSTGEELLKWLKTGKAQAPAHPRPDPGSSLPQPMPSNEPKPARQAKTRINTDGEEYGMSADGVWFEAGGVRFDSDIFVMNPENDQPRYTKDGLFRVRRGKVQVAESLRAQSPAQPPAQPSEQPPAQSPAQPSGQIVEQSPAQPWAQPGALPWAQLQEQPSEQPPEQPSEQPVAQPSEQPPAQPPEQPPAQPPAQPPEQPPAQPPEQPQAQPAAQPPEQPQAQPAAQPAAQPQDATLYTRLNDDGVGDLKYGQRQSQDVTPYTRLNPDRLDQATSRDELREIYEEAVKYMFDPELLKAWRTVYNANMVRLVSAE